MVADAPERAADDGAARALGARLPLGVVRGGGASGRSLGDTVGGVERSDGAVDAEGPGGAGVGAGPRAARELEAVAVPSGSEAFVARITTPAATTAARITPTSAFLRR